jgi:uncharacterized protein involved in outer membrane biogenesis
MGAGILWESVMKVLIKIVVGLLILVSGVLGAAYYLVSTYDREELKTLAQTQTKKMTGRDLVINGPLEIAISLRPAIVLEDVSFANASWGTRDQMVTMKRIELSLSLLDILSGQLRVNRFTLVEPDILLETDRRGNGNWDIPLSASDPAANADDGSDPIVSLSGVDDISILGGTLTYRDGATGDTLVFSLDEVNGKLPSLSGGSISLKGDLDGTPMTLSSGISGENDKYTLTNMALTYGATDLNGSGSLSLSGKPTLNANLTSNLLDLSGFMAPTSDDPTEETSGQFVFTNEPFPLEGLRTIDVTAAINANKVKVSDAIMITDMNIDMSLRSGDLKLGNLGGKMFGGTVSGNLGLNSSRSPARLATSLTVTDLDYGTVLKAFGVSEEVDGTISMNMDLKGQGNSARSMASTLNGGTEVVAIDGVITNQVLAVVVSGLDNIMKPLLGGSTNTKLNCFVSRMDIRGGVASSKDFVLDSSAFSVVGEGTIDLRDERLDLLFDTETREAALVSLAIPFRVKGTLANPTAAPDPMAVIGAATKIFGGFSGSGGSSASSGNDAISSVLGGFLGGKKKKSAPAPQPQPTATQVDVCAKLGVI